MACLPRFAVLEAITVASPDLACTRTTRRTRTRKRNSRAVTGAAATTTIPAQRTPDPAPTPGTDDARERWLTETLARAPDLPAPVRARIARILHDPPADD
ncbi:hypothetical protein CcI49_18845 [Frankia sp. CcI49]|uniref:hypothetical protein n=1 Tax=Frankia sp. CcI49 TaxID=1745382 RepID=UPI0009774093|nr:hypothetical protein [Frankia sp. CcI49]ONH58811.1 hypothetical protein CcI49_18845 [Frankia sp. CcI49]